MASEPDTATRSRARRVAGVLSAVFLLLPALTDAETYKWIDADGKVHYSDAPPPDRKARKIELKINSISGPPVISAIRGAPATAGASLQRVRLFTTSWCGYCKKAIAYLRSRGTPFEELDVETSPQGKREYEGIKGRGVPIILVGNRRMDGYDQATLAGMLADAGL